MGDNGTGGGTPSRFKGRDVTGGKGSSLVWGTHVPGIANWPGQVASGKVCADMIESADMLPTICEAAGVAVPANIDGVSFLSQLRGDSGTPREWLYSWYSPRQNADMTVRECAFDHNFKLYRTGEFFNLAEDPDENSPLQISSLADMPAAAARKLQSALDQFADARPFELDEQVRKSTDQLKPARKKKKPNDLQASLDIDKPNYRFVMKGDSLAIDDLQIWELK